jgi:rRNA large subunit m3Psi methyltransferase RlmH
LAVKLILNMPFRIDPNGPFASAAHEWTSRVERVTEWECVAPRKKTLTPQELEAFYLSRMEAFAGSVVWAFDERGDEMDSLGMAKQIQRLRDQGCRSLHLCLGGAHGLPSVLGRVAGLRLVRLSRLTFAHELAALVVLEQVYRSMSILSGHPYHHGAPSDLVRERARAADRRLN